MMKFGKLYQSLKHVSAEWHAGNVQWSYCWDYLRFYEDGLVISCYSNGDIEEIERWFRADNSNVPYSKGEFKIGNNQVIEITLPALIGSIEMDGSVFSDYIILRSFNKEMRQGERWDRYSLVDSL